MDDIMDDIIDNRLAAGPRERPMNCADCLHWCEEEEEEEEEEEGDDLMICNRTGEATSLNDYCSDWEEI